MKPRKQPKPTRRRRSTTATDIVEQARAELGRITEKIAALQKDADMLRRIVAAGEDKR